MARQKNVKLLLVENVENLGIVGDVVNVRPGYARNYLMPMSMAATPTASAIKRVEARRAEVQRTLAEERKRREALVQKIAGIEITLQRTANEQGILFGSVTPVDIVAALAEQGHHINDRDVRLAGPIKQLDSYEVPIHLAKDLVTTIKLWVVSDKPAEELIRQATAEEEEAEALPVTEVFEEAKGGESGEKKGKSKGKRGGGEQAE